MIFTELVHDEQTFRGLRSVWDTMLGQNASSSIFLTWEWLFTWWRHYHEDKKLFLILFWEGEKLVGIAPLSQAEEMRAGLRVRTLRFLGSDEPVCSEFLDLIIAPGYEMKVYHRWLEFLRETYWDRIVLNSLALDNSKLHHLYRLASQSYLVESEETFVCPYINLPIDWDQFLGRLSRNFRYQVRSTLRKFESQSDLEYVSNAQKIFPVSSLINTLSKLNGQRMEQKGIDSTLKIFSFRQFLVDVLEKFQSKGWLSCALIQNNQHIVAIIFNFRYAGKIWYYQAGFLPEYAVFRPGTLLFALSIQEAMAQGLTEYDFLRGEESYKYRWGCLNRPVTTFRFYNKKILSQVIYHFRRAKIRLFRPFRRLWTL